MKTIIAAMALALALPAAAQAAPAAADPHAAHKKGEAEHDCKACCEKMKTKDGKMDCMDKAGAKGAHQGHDGAAAKDAHQGHQPN